MHADLMLNVANLSRLSKNSRDLFNTCKFNKQDHMTIMKALLYFEGFDIKINTKINDAGIIAGFAIGQVSFFKLIDFMGLARMRTFRLQEFLKRVGDIGSDFSDESPFFCFTSFTASDVGQMYTSDDESYWDEYDIQPFRNYLFETQRASAEFFNIIKDLGYDDNNCAINNYDNTIEFQGDSIAYLLLMVGYWIEDWEQMIEEYQLFTMLFNDLNSAKAEGAIWSRPVLDSMWRHLKPRTTSLGEPAIT